MRRESDCNDYHTLPLPLLLSPGAQLTAVGASTDVARLSSACGVLKAGLQPLVQHLHKSLASRAREPHAPCLTNPGRATTQPKRT